MSSIDQMIDWHPEKKNAAYLNIRECSGLVSVAKHWKSVGLL